MNEREIVETIKNKIAELNALFEEGASYYIKFDCNFSQGSSYGQGNVAHLILKAYKEI